MHKIRERRSVSNFHVCACTSLVDPESSLVCRPCACRSSRRLLEYVPCTLGGIAKHERHVKNLTQRSGNPPENKKRKKKKRAGGFFSFWVEIQSEKKYLLLAIRTSTCRLKGLTVSFNDFSLKIDARRCGLLICSSQREPGLTSSAVISRDLRLPA